MSTTDKKPKKTDATESADHIERPTAVAEIACPKCQTNVVLFFSFRKNAFYMCNSIEHTDFHNCSRKMPKTP